MLKGGPVILGQGVAVEIHEAQAELGAATAPVGASAEPLDGRVVVGWHT